VAARQQVLVYGEYTQDAGSTLDIQPSGQFVILQDNSIEGLHKSTTATYVSATGSAGAVNTAQTVLSRTLPANSLRQVGDRLRVRAYFLTDGGAGIDCSIKLGPLASEVLVSNITHTGAGTFDVVETWLHYIDDTHANLIEQYPGGGGLGALTAINVAGFDWDANQSIIITQSASASNFITVYGMFVDIMPKGI
jgi:hypothetical protein